MSAGTDCTLDYHAGSTLFELFGFATVIDNWNVKWFFHANEHARRAVAAVLPKRLLWKVAEDDS